MEGEITTTDPGTSVGLAVFNEDGTLLFWTLQYDPRPDRWPKLDPGHRVLEVEIPPHLLNEGTYRLELMLAFHFRGWLAEPGVSARRCS